MKYKKNDQIEYTIKTFYNSVDREKTLNKGNIFEMKIVKAY